jgi:hypothetical protein
MTRWFLLAWTTAVLVSVGLVRVALGPDESIRLLLAWTASLPGAIASLLLAERSAVLPPTKRTAYLAAGHPIRMLLTLAIALGYWCVILSAHFPSFWVWIVITYALTLAGDVWLTLRVIRAGSPVSPSHLVSGPSPDDPPSR